MPRLLDSPATGFSISLFGAPGSWKTSLMRSLPPDSTRYIEIEGGSTPLRRYGWNADFACPRRPDKKNPNVFKNDLDDSLNFLRFQQHSIKYCVLDSATEIEKYFQIALAYAAGKDITSLHEYGGASDLTYKALVEFRDLKFPECTATKVPVNTIFLCGEFPLEITRTQDSVISVIYPMLTRKMAVKIAHLLDVLARLEIRGLTDRFLRFQPTDSIACKSRFDLQNMSVSADFNFYTSVILPIEEASRTNVHTAAHPATPTPPAANKSPAQKLGRLS